MSYRLVGQPLPLFDLDRCFIQLHIAFLLPEGELGRASQTSTDVTPTRQECICGQGSIRGCIPPLRIFKRSVHFSD